MKNFLVIFSLLLSACSTTRIIKEETAPGVDLSAYKTFNYYSFHAAGDTTPRKTNQRLSQIRKAITKELNQKGYTFSANNPDFLVNISMNVKQDVQTRDKKTVTDEQAYVGQKNYTWQAEDVVEGYYKTGTMELHIIDAKEKTLVWQNISEGVLADKESDVEKRMEMRFKKVFNDFPVFEKIDTSRVYNLHSSFGISLS